MHLLPGEITTDVLSRLPVDSVIQCKRVCKTWRSLIDDPAFVDLHTRRFISSVSDEENHKFGFILLMRKMVRSYELRFGEYNDDNNNYDDIDVDKKEKISRCFKLSKSISTNHPYPEEGSTWSLMNSCNGLIIMHSYYKRRLVICNPLTREYLDIPRFATTDTARLCTATGFGYIPSTDEDKIVAVYNNYTDVFTAAKVSMYTLGSCKWRDHGETSHELGVRSVHLNGAVYWVTENTSEIVLFNLETEEFRIVPSPPLPPDMDMYYEKVGLLGGCLYVIRKHNYDRADVLVRNEENHTWSWKFSITYKDLCSDCEPLATLRSGKILWHSAYFKPYVGYCDPQTESLEMHDDLRELIKCMDIIHYKKSFVSLKALGEMNAQKYDLGKHTT